MRIARVVAMACCMAAVVALMGPWNARLAGAQSPSAEKWCMSFHATHPVMTARQAREKGVPAGYRIHPCRECGTDDELLLREEPVLDGGDLADARPDVDHYLQRPIVTFRFNAEGTRKFAAFSRESIGRPFAIVVDGRVISAPFIQEPILGGSGQIAGANFTRASVESLAARMRSPSCQEAR